MSAEHVPKVPTYADCARTDKPAIVTAEFVSKDDERAPAVHCTNIAVAGGVKYSTWFGGSYEGSTDNQIWSALFLTLKLATCHIGVKQSGQVLQRYRWQLD